MASFIVTMACPITSISAIAAGSSLPSSSSTESVKSSTTGLPRSSHWGEVTWFNVSLGACGYHNDDQQPVVAISHSLFDDAPGYNGLNSNTNPYCGEEITICRDEHSHRAKIVDRCTGCSTYSLDLSPALFCQLAPLSIGRIPDVEWWFVK